MTVIGRRDRLPPVLLRAIEAAEEETRGGNRLLLRIAIDYSARDAILTAAAGLQPGEQPDRERFADLLAAAVHSAPVPDVDLLIRTGGEQRLSDFLLWECAYAELLFESCLWPDFSPARLQTAMQEFRRRDRRFGGLSQAAAG